jgi:hypothetical protein
MARAYLRQVHPGDARPEPLNEAVLARACTARMAEIKAWLSPRVLSITEDEIVFALTTAIGSAGADGFRAATVLKNEFLWPVDMELCLLVRDTVTAMAQALRAETRVWVLRTGMRFPAKSEDSIEFIDGVGKTRTGKVTGIDSALAAAFVQPFDGLIRAGGPTRVLAEQVMKNISTGEQGPHLLSAQASPKARPVPVAQSEATQ